jgi:hypothetical protein
MKGFSPSNLKYMRAFAEAWPDGSIRQQPVGELPWGHNVVLLTRLKTYDERLQLIESLPKNLEASLPSVQRIEEELSKLPAPTPSRPATKKPPVRGRRRSATPC